MYLDFAVHRLPGGQQQDELAGYIRLSRLAMAEWDSLKTTVKSEGPRLVVANMPTTHQILALSDGVDIGTRIMQIINEMLVDLMATMASLDHEKRVGVSSRGWTTSVPVVRRWAARAVIRRNGIR